MKTPDEWNALLDGLKCSHTMEPDERAPFDCVLCTVEAFAACQREAIEECAKVGESALTQLWHEGMARNVPHCIGDPIRALTPRATDGKEPK